VEQTTVVDVTAMTAHLAIQTGVSTKNVHFVGTSSNGEDDTHTFVILPDVTDPAVIEQVNVKAQQLNQSAIKFTNNGVAILGFARVCSNSDENCTI